MTTPTLTIDDISALRALAEKATPGPWRQHLVDDTTVIDEAGNTVAQTFPDGGLDDDVDFATDTEQREHDAAFIATARTALPAALDEIERLRAALCVAQGGSVPVVANPGLLPAALSEADRLREENEKLRKALMPFARLRRIFGGKEPDDFPGMPDSHGYAIVWVMEEHGRCDLTLGHFRRARRALDGGGA